MVAAHANSVTSVSTATFNGATIDLQNGWGGATACIVPATGGAECFATLAEAKSAATAISQAELSTSSGGSNAQSRGHRAVSHGGACQGNSGEWLWLYQNSNYGGNALGIQNTNVWFDLQTAGFGDETSSYSNDTGCSAYMSKSTDGSGSLLTANPWEALSYVGNTWNDQINSVVIAY